MHGHGTSIWLLNWVEVEISKRGGGRKARFLAPVDGGFLSVIMIRYAADKYNHSDTPHFKVHFTYKSNQRKLYGATQSRSPCCSASFL